MSRKVLERLDYTFNPATRTIVINSKFIPREKLALITNVTTNQVIYNFSDPSLKATAYTNNINSAMVETTTIVLNYNTTSMASTDKLQIIIDEYEERFVPSEAYLDPTNKLRTTTPQALIDTDFEYGTQITKWENLAMINQRPFAFPSSIQIPNITSMTMLANAKVVTVVLSSGTFPANGTAIYVQDTFLSIANGNFTIESGGGTASATYTARAANSTGVTAIFDSNKTAIFQGSQYSSARIGLAPTMSYTGTQITVTTTVPHGLSIGNEIVVIGTTASTNAPNGSFIVTTIISPTQFRYYTAAAPTGTLVATSAFIYNLPQGQVLHRPFDGGVIFSSNSSSNYEQMIRQTRRYFRYQSGKGIQASSGTILKPNLQLDSITSVGSLVTVQTKEKHNILPGTTIIISGVTDPAYNGTFVVNSVTGFNTFQYTALSIPASGIGSGPYYAAIDSWYGAANSLGIFDDQNGLFFEFDGRTLYAVKRSSTFQLAGRVSVTNGSNTVSQTVAAFPTILSKQLFPGDFIVIRGQSYKVQDIASDTSITISPSYRGATASHVIVSKTVDTKVSQSEFNLDKCDGTGPSGYNLDLTKMQMFYIDYSWYGAGFVRWGLRGPNGNVFYVHKQVNNNVNNEAYMRSGNLPARYESITFPYVTTITSSVGASDAVLPVRSTSGFPPSGTLCIRDASKYEYVNYTGLSASAFSGLTRAQAGVTSAVTVTITSGTNSGTVVSASNIQIGQRVVSASFPEGTFVTNIVGTTLTFSNAATGTNPGDVLFPPMGATTGQTFTFSATAPVAVEQAFPTYGPTISHWGTSVIMDGRFDDDKSLVFTYGQTGFTGVPATQTRALFSIRVAPSIDQGTPGIFGARELINRMQLVLRALDITTNTANSNLLITAVLNGTPSSTTNWTNAVNNVTTVQNSSLAQIANYAGGSTTISGGEITAGFFVGSGANSVDLNPVRDLGNSILGGGGTTSNVNIYPDGPDTLTIAVTNLSPSASASVLGRLSWTEAQA